MANYDYLRTKFVKTRKDHSCWGCKRSIPKGTNMFLAVYKYDRKLENAYWCMVCFHILQRLAILESDSWFSEGELRENTPDWEDLRKQMEGGVE